MLLKTVEHVQNLLKQNEKFIDKDGNIFTQNILEAIEKIDRDLVKLLLSDEKIREQFFIKIDDVFVLEQNKLIEFFTMNEYFNNSFTSYTNKIGLIKKDSFIKKFDDVVLAWPHKDCVLEGGQSKDDEKNNEVFYNEILSRDEIDRLFEPKALTNIKRYTKDGVEENSQINEDDNLIIKGNNLIALHSLKKKYARKVKLIYIDPPYNTGNDSFKYNDRFNHSTWLTFMKNRLEVAREFLSDDGVIFVSIDDNEQAYLKVLMDDVFGSDCFVGNFVWKKRQASGKQVAENYFSVEHEYITIFCKNKEKFKFKGVSRDRKSYTNPDNDPRGDWAKHPLDVGSTKEERPNCFYTIIDPKTGIGHEANPKRVWAFAPNSMKKLIKEEKILFHPEGKTRPYLKKFWTDLKSDMKPISSWIKYGNDIDELEDIISLSSNYNTEGTKLINEMFGEKVFDTAKPLTLITSLINSFISNNDIILDFHAGSGTTAHAVLDINKEQNKNLKFILIEQMDYIKNITCERVKKVIEKNQEGSFIYAELKQINNFKDVEIGKLNANMQYLPVLEMQDADYDMSDEEIQINKKFYELENE